MYISLGWKAKRVNMFRFNPSMTCQQTKQNAASTLTLPGPLLRSVLWRSWSCLQGLQGLLDGRHQQFWYEPQCRVRSGIRTMWSTALHMCVFFSWVWFCLVVFSLRLVGHLELVFNGWTSASFCRHAAQWWVGVGSSCLFCAHAQWWCGQRLRDTNRTLTQLIWIFRS